MEYRILFGFMRGKAGEVIEVNQADAGILLDAGLIAPLDVAENRETKVVVPESKEGGGADNSNAGRRRSKSTDG